jgi:hypothetical protein
VGVLIGLAQDQDVCLVTSPRGPTFIDADALEAMTGHPVRSDYKNLGEPDVLPAPDAMIVAPATTNTINKRAAGISDTLPLGLIVEGIGKRLPHRGDGEPTARRPRTRCSRKTSPPVLEVTVLYGPDVYLLHEPGEGGHTAARFPWHLTIDALSAARP